MFNFAANLTMLFQELPFIERFEAAKTAGFNYVEYLFPYAYEAEALKAELDKHSLKQVLFNLPPGDWDAGERGIACHPDRIQEFRDGVDQAIGYAKVLEVKQINCLAGLQPKTVSEELAWQTLLDNVGYAADKLAAQGITLMLEPINSRVDMPGFFIDTLDKALKVIEALGRDNLKVQFDLYHMQIMQGDLIRSLAQHLDHIGHIQFADNPGRHQPGSGEINFENVFKALKKSNYQGWASAEYLPSHNTEQSLAWLRTFNWLQN